MINALHKFSSSYFSGNVKITEGPGRGRLLRAASKDEAQPEPGCRIWSRRKRRNVRPSRSRRSKNAINAYVQSAQAPAPKP